MNRGLIAKAIREAWPMTVLFGLALAAFQALIVGVFPSFLQESASVLLEIDFFRTMLRGLLGTEIGPTLGPDMLSSMAWVHPIVLAMVWAHEITLCTRVPAGEVDRGTIDLMLGWPVSRAQIYLGVTVVWLIAGLGMILTGVIGNVISAWMWSPEARTPAATMSAIVTNLYALYVAVGGAALMVSAASDRRGRAIGVAFGFVLFSFFLNFIAQLWDVAESVSFLSVLNYYRPLVIVRDGAWPIADIVVLTGIGAVLWTVGAVIFARRDIRTL